MGMQYNLSHGKVERMGCLLQPLPDGDWEKTGFKFNGMSASNCASYNLKLYLQLGLIVTKAHRVLTFKQSPLLKAFEEPCKCPTDYRRSYFMRTGC